MYLNITSQTFYKNIPIPANTIMIGVKMKNLVVNNTLSFLFENIECTTKKISLPDNTNIKFYFYTTNDQALIELANDNRNIPLFKFTQNNVTITVAYEKQLY